MLALIKTHLAAIGAAIMLSGCTTADQQLTGELITGFAQVAFASKKPSPSTTSGRGGYGTTVCGSGPSGGCR